MSMGLLKPPAPASFVHDTLCLLSQSPVLDFLQFVGGTIYRGRGDSSAAPGANSWPPLPSQHDQGGAGGDAEQRARGPRRYTQSRPGAQQGDGGAQGAGSKGGLSVEAQEYVPPAGNRGKAAVAQQQQYNGNSGSYGARQPQGQGQGHQGKQEYGGGFSSGATPAPATPTGYAPVPQQQFGGQGWSAPVAPNTAPPMPQSGPQPAPIYPTIPVMPPHVQVRGVGLQAAGHGRAP